MYAKWDRVGASATRDVKGHGENCGHQSSLAADASGLHTDECIVC